MLNFKIGKIVAYIDQTGIDLEKAAKEFFGNYEIYPDMPDFEQISSLFNEWLAFHGLNLILKYTSNIQQSLNIFSYCHFVLIKFKLVKLMSGREFH